MVTVSHINTTLVQTSSLFDPTTLSFQPNRDFIIDHSTGLIQRIYERSSTPNTTHHTHVLDLRRPNLTVLPGLIDAHTHLFLHPYAEASNDYQRVNESLLERTIRATVHAKRTLLAGFTTIRDLGTESALDADIAIRNAIEKGIIPGPRVLAATQAVVSSGSYEPPNSNAEGGGRVPPGGDVGDGVEGCRAAVRRRLGAGADVIKVYADYPRLRPQRYPTDGLFPPSRSSPAYLDHPCFTPAELSAIAAEAALTNTPVAAHVKSAAQIMACLSAGIHTIEHGYDADDACFVLMKEKGAVWVPTLAAVRTIYGAEDQRYEAIQKTFMKGVAAGVAIAAGGDTGVFAHGENALEMACMVEAGMSVPEALKAATSGGFEACGGEAATGRRFGILEEGACADFVVVEGKPDAEEFVETMGRVRVVYKNGIGYKNELV